jgi:hypothetical protein
MPAEVVTLDERSADETRPDRANRLIRCVRLARPRGIGWPRGGCLQRTTKVVRHERGRQRPGCARGNRR